MGRMPEFFRGLVAGALGTLLGASAALYLLARAGLIALANDEPREWLTWAYTNLGSSIPVFAVLLLAFFVTLSRLSAALDGPAPVTRIVHLDQLSDTWTTLFFGTGVIWTAIGMRSALLFALGDRQTAVADGAFAMLERMIDGGILLALSTTIFGGVGGYLLRVYKTISVGGRLQHCYAEAAREDTQAMRDSLQRIERRLRAQATQAAS